MCNEKWIYKNEKRFLRADKVCIYVGFSDQWSGL